MSTVVTAKTKTDMVVENVIQTIATNNYQPGDKIPPESYFIKEYDVSRVTVREAFKRLSSMGVVTIKSGDGTFVNTIKPFEVKEALLPLLAVNPDAIEELYETRICIELFIVELAAKRRTSEDVAELSQIVHEMETCLENSDIDGYSSFDDEFHNCLSRICDNTILQSIYESLTMVRKANITKSNKADVNLAESIQEHRDILQAIKAGAVDPAKSTLEKHLLRSKRHMLGK